MQLLSQPVFPKKDGVPRILSHRLFFVWSFKLLQLENTIPLPLEQIPVNNVLG